MKLGAKVTRICEEEWVSENSVAEKRKRIKFYYWVFRHNARKDGHDVFIKI